ncbi:MAG: NAD(+)/NADH kinase [Candidatus Krumholzibacteriia bacterium]
MRISALGLFGNPHKAELGAAVAAVRDLCGGMGVDVLLTESLAAAVGGGAGLGEEELVARSDIIAALGGDGTMLRAARLIGTSGVPLLGINLGSLGYLTDVPLDELEPALQRLLAGEAHLDARSRVYGDVIRAAESVAHTSGLNDLVVNMGPLPRALHLELVLDGVPLGRVLGDGMIFSTPTGSTAYNLSAGGPICQPDLSCLLLTPICPHTLGMRPLIVSGDMKIELVLHNAGEGATLTADGQTATRLQSGDRLLVRSSAPEVQLVKFPWSNAYRVMHHKLGWGTTGRQFGRET